MPRLEHQTAQFFSLLSQELRQEIVSPEQVKRLSSAIAQLPPDARLTSAEIEGITRSTNLTAPHRATLVLALLLHRYPSLKEQLKDQNTLGDGLAGVVDALISRVQQNDGQPVAEALEKFYLAYAGPRAATENSGVELFKTAPAIQLDPTSEVVQVQLNRAAHGSFIEGGEGGWVYRPEKQGAAQPPDVPLGRLNILSLELLAQGVSAYIGTRSHGQQPPRESDALAIARDVGIAGALLRDVMRVRDQRNSELLSERSTREKELRLALGEFRVQRIGQETVNELVHAMFGKEKK